MHLQLRLRDLPHNWDISAISLAPEDKIEFYLLVSDNNDVTGPSITKTNLFVGTVPSLEDLFNDIVSIEEDILDKTNEIDIHIDDVKELVDEIEKEMLKSDEISWEQSQKVNETADKIDDIISEIEAINNAIENIQDQIENNDLLDQSLLEKFDEFQNLLDSVMTPEMLETLNKIKDMMDKLSTDQMIGEIQNFKQDISTLDEQLDRFIELFERAMAEQIFDELIKYLEEMIDNQFEISEKLMDPIPEFSQIYSKQKIQEDRFFKFQFKNK